MYGFKFYFTNRCFYINLNYKICELMIDGSEPLLIMWRDVVKMEYWGSFTFYIWWNGLVIFRLG